MKLKDLPSSLQKSIKKAVKKTPFDDLGQAIADDIKERTQQGKGVDDNGDLFNLAPLSDAYVKKREKLNLSPLTSSKGFSGRSNLTQTGKMLDSLKVTYTEDGFSIEPGARFVSITLGLQTGNLGKKRGPKRTFMGFSNDDINFLTEEIEDHLQDEINKELKNQR
ncbi:Phage virion morphogenesis family like protein [uncultured Mediterranean phage uvMED]|nr:Phage virion morphogenesis family like protein [uncultured Mediterranean phage uvMED]